MEIILKNLQKKIPISRGKILKAAKEAFCELEKRERFKVPPFSLSIVFVGTMRMRSVNKRYLDHDHVTDVLTFDLGDGQAEIMICPQVAQKNAKAFQTSTDNEMILYLIHGILHLAGYDDHSEKDILKMRHMENKLLK